MKRFFYYVKLYAAHLRRGFLVVTQYPLDSTIGIFSLLSREAATFLGVYVIASISGGIGGWNLYEICLLFSLGAITESIGQAFFDSVWSVGSCVRKGLLDVYLVRPTSIFFQLITQRMAFPSIISFFVATALMIISLVQLNVVISIGTILFFIEFLICGNIINSSIYLFFNCLDFWFVNGSNASDLAQTLREFVKYPLGVFPFVIKGFFTFVIPFGFIGYYPAAYLTGKTNLCVPLLLPLVAGILACICRVIWRKGLNSYNSTGT